MENEKVELACKHGRLKRSCEVCRLEQELKDRSKLLYACRLELANCEKMIAKIKESHEEMIASLDEQIIESIRMEWL